MFYPQRRWWGIAATNMREIRQALGHDIKDHVEGGGQATTIIGVTAGSISGFSWLTKVEAE
jgi:hypothetical protein